MERAKEAGLETVAAASKPWNVASGKPTNPHTASSGRGKPPTNDNPDGEPFFEWPKRRGEVVRAQISVLNGTKFLNIRVWVPNAAGELEPTRKGATLPLESIGELGAALCRVDLLMRSEQPQKPF